MPKKEFTAKLERFEGVGTWIYVDVPFDVEKTYGKSGQVKVKGTVNGKAFRSSLMPHGDGTHFLVVNKKTRDTAQADIGHKVRVVLDIDTEERLVQVPPDFERSLAKNKSAKAAFEKQSFSHKKEYVDWIVSAKKDETRKRRIEKATASLARKTALNI